MPRLIDADALVKRIEETKRDWNEKKAIYSWNYAYDSFIDDIDKQPTVGGWISVKDRMPAETHSIFYPWFGKKQWNKAMWREQSDKVLVTVAFKDGTRIVTTGETHDGVWNTTISRTLEPVVTHWMPLPEPKEED